MPKHSNTLGYPLTYIRGTPTRTGYWWRRCSDRRTSDRIVYLDVCDLGRLLAGAPNFKVHSCEQCQWAGPIPEPFSAPKVKEARA